jgi:hypothetical protein
MRATTPGAHHPFGPQVVAGELDQQRGAVVLEGPGQEEVVEGLQLPGAGAAPAEAPQHLSEVVPADPVLPAAVGGEGAGFDPEVVGEAP